MKSFVALLRAVNVGGKKMAPMSELREMCSAIGLADARTVLQTGNIVFRARSTMPASLERLLESETAARLRVETTYFVRNAAEWSRVVERNPFAEQARRDPGRLVLVCLRDAPDDGAVAALQAAVVGREVVRVEDRHAYIVYPDGQGRSKLTNAVIERKLGTRGTARNWNTVLKIAALLEP